MELVFREVVFADKDEIISLFIDTYKREPWNENWESEIAHERIKGFMENNLSGNYCVTNKDNKIIGVLLGHTNFFVDKKEFFIEEFFIDHDHQGKGIAKKFMEYVENEIKQKGHASMVLLTKKSFPSEKFYTNIDFKTSQSVVLMFKEMGES